MSNEVEQMRQAKAELARAKDAEQVLNNLAFVEAVQLMRQDCLGAFQKAKQSDTKKHSEIWLQLNAVNELVANLTYLMNNGAFAEEDISMLQRAKRKIGL